jgi:arylformamidase
MSNEMAGRMVDLTLPIREGMQTFPTHWHPVVEITQLGRHGLENRETRKLVLGTHTGTHLDAPRHFIPNGATVDQYPLEQLVGMARIVDFSDLEPLREITPELLRTRVGEVTTLPKVILRFDWDKQLGSMRYYSDHPFLSVAAAQWLIDKGCRLVAMDTPQPDNPAHHRHGPVDAPIHKLLLGAHVALVEYLINVSALTVLDVWLVVAPLLIEGGDGAPVRCFAIERA